MSIEDEFKGFEEYACFLFEFFQESDRACVVLGAAKLDELLEKMLLAALSTKAEKKDELFGPERPFGTFSSKINIAYRMGLIDKDLRRILHKFRKLRNDFSHNVFGCKLNESPNKEKVSELIEEMAKEPTYQKTLELYPVKEEFPQNYKEFRVAIIYLIIRLDALAYHIKPVHEVNRQYVENNRPPTC